MFLIGRTFFTGCAESKFQELFSLDGRQLSRFSKSEFAQANRSESDSLQMHDFMSYTSEQTTNLAIFALAELDFQDCAFALLLDFFRVMNFELSFFEEQSFAEFLIDFAIWFSRNQHSVCSENAISRVLQTLGQIAVVGDEEESFRVLVEPTDSKQMRAVAGDQIDGETSPTRIAMSAEHTFGFIQDVISFGFELDDFGINANFVLFGIDFESEFGHEFTIDFHASLDDQLLALTARGDP